MDDTQREAVIDALFLMAWKDGRVQAEEKSVLDRILSKLGVPRGDIMRMIETRSTGEPPVLDHLETVLPDHEERLLAMKMLIAVCFADNELAMEELDYIYSLATRLGIRADELDMLRVEAEKIVDPSLAVTPMAAGPIANPPKPAVGRIKLE